MIVKVSNAVDRFEELCKKNNIPLTRIGHLIYSLDDKDYERFLEAYDGEQFFVTPYKRKAGDSAGPGNSYPMPIDENGVVVYLKPGVVTPDIEACLNGERYCAPNAEPLNRVYVYDKDNKGFCVLEDCFDHGVYKGKPIDYGQYRNITFGIKPEEAKPTEDCGLTPNVKEEEPMKRKTTYIVAADSVEEAADKVQRYRYKKADKADDGLYADINAVKVGLADFILRHNGTATAEDMIRWLKAAEIKASPELVKEIEAVINTIH